MNITSRRRSGLLRDAAAGKSSMKLGTSKTGTVLPWKAFANLKVILAVTTFALFVGSTWVIASEPERIRVRDVLSSSGRTLSDSQRWENYRKVSQEKLRDPADVKAVHEEMKKLMSEVKDEEQGLRLMRMTELLAAPLAAATDPSAHGAVRDLLDTESRSLPRNYSGPWTASTREEEIQEGMRWARVEALMKAAGDGKNEEALPALRRIFRQGGLVSEEAARTIGKIGRREDLDMFINAIKDDPSVRIDLTPFGSIALDTILREAGKSNLTEDQRDTLIGSMPEIKDRNDLSKYLELLKNKDTQIVASSAIRIGRILQPGDENLIRLLIADPRRSVSGPAFSSLGQMMDHGEAVAICINVLENNQDYLRRSTAASFLGRSTIRTEEVITSLRAAAERDTSRVVRDAAQHAIESINKSSPR